MPFAYQSVSFVLIYNCTRFLIFVKDIPNGVQMTDIVDYKLPLGFLGRFAHWLFVKKKVKSIFDYREQKLESIFGKYE